LLVHHIRRQGAELSWTTPPGAVHFDVIYGALSDLRSNGGDFSDAQVGCLESDTTQSTRRFPARVPPGQGFWFVVRYETELGEDTYDSNSISQVGSRDQEIDSAPASCP
jgi:hypothetical protein